MDISLTYDNNTQQYDYSLTGSMFQQTQDLETLVQVMLFSDKTAPDYFTKEKRGWWGESDYPEDTIGSWLWMLKYADQQDYTQLAQTYVQTALEPLTQYSLCDSYSCECEYSQGTLTITITITKGQTETEYEYVWQGV